MFLINNRFYNLIYSLFLPLQILNAWSIGPIKLFYIPVGVMGIIGLCYFNNLIKYDRYLKYIAGFAFLLMLSVVMGGFKVFFPLLSLYAILSSFIIFSALEKILFFRLSPYIYFISLILSFIFAPWPGLPYRFTGLYNDPNYFVMAMIVGIYICVKSYSLGGFYHKLICILSILLSLHFTILTQSRGGIVSLLVFGLFYLYVLYKNNRKAAYTVIVLSGIFSGILINNYGEGLTLVVERFAQKKSTDKGSSESRLREASGAIASISFRPEYLLFGAGYAITNHARISGDNKRESSAILLKKELIDNHYLTNIRIHVTPIAIIYENGLLPFITLTIIVLMLLYGLYRSRDWLTLGFFLALLMQSLTFFAIPFLPFWEGFFLVISECHTSKNIHSNIREF
ncbi:O-antigen ligase family protein [Bacteroides acidifaciens]|jgi:hypothetical protein|uniref:O-antigen ligase family protein n=3 Tax=Bacteroidales TaxID=171549 RepID=UPI0025B5B36F|nr:O-antigen ligase family protein [Bacteroides acidifaciens]